MSEAEKFQKYLGTQLVDHLGEGYIFLRSKLELRQKGKESSNVIVLAGSNKYSPDVSVSFYVGRHFEEIKKVEKALGLEPMPYHIQQYSPNLQNMINHPNIGARHTWRININNPPESFPEEMCTAIRQISEPFFERFDTLESSRDALAINDSWCFGGPAFWRSLLLFDAALDDIHHFSKWATHLNSVEREQAELLLARYKEI
ncbi:hypothetical protein L4D00_23150 [Photobacterium swingsii]|uniref:hypothetical protein n=1 Tax=Photobacterium swingsii TaxID=680026 RepID=UPI003D0E9CE2